jgi:hypothetical protein
MADQVQQQAPQSLFQQVQSNLQKMAAPQSMSGILGATQDVAKISQAATGKAGAAPGMQGPQRDTQQELAVVDQVQQGQKAISRDAQLSQLAMQQADQQMQNEAVFQDKKLDEEELNRLDQFHQVQGKILQEYATGQRQLDLSKDKAKLEQLGFASRLSNDKYVRDLQQQANKARLSDAARFSEELTRTVFADEEELFRNDLNFRALMAADQRQFTEATAQIDLDFALSLANAKGREESAQSMWRGVGGVISAGAQFATSDTGSKWLNQFFGGSTLTPTPTAIEEAAGMSMPTQHQFNPSQDLNYTPVTNPLFGGK